MTPFAEINSVMNSAIVDFLADAEADFGGGVIVSGLFRNPTSSAFGFVEGSKPSFESTSESLMSVGKGDAVTINGAVYEVFGIDTQSGMTVLNLEEV